MDYSMAKKQKQWDGEHAVLSDHLKCQGKLKTAKRPIGTNDTTSKIRPKSKRPALTLHMGGEEKRNHRKPPTSLKMEEGIRGQGLPV